MPVSRSLPRRTLFAAQSVACVSTEMIVIVDIRRVEPEEYTYTYSRVNEKFEGG